MNVGLADGRSNSPAIRWVKYLAAYSSPVVGGLSFYLPGVGAWALPMYVFLFVPALELLMRPDPSNLSAVEEEIVRADRLYDWMLYLMLPIQYVLMGLFLFSVAGGTATAFELAGRILGMGILCGALGINVAHELGHRANRFERNIARALLLSSLYMHFIIEHNRGHHRRVSTAEDPASARYGEWLYTFWFRSVFGGYASAWHLETERRKRRKIPFFSVQNEMLVNHLIQGCLLALIWWVFGPTGLGMFVLVSILGILLLETVNYIEHYGLRRKRNSSGYERVSPHHSWNSDHVIGRLLLFELSRHSDHHFEASRKYQILRSYDNSPQMPTGYPGMIVLALFPPLWFWVMHRQIRSLNAGEETIIFSR